MHSILPSLNVKFHHGSKGVNDFSQAPLAEQGVFLVIPISLMRSTWEIINKIPKGKEKPLLLMVFTTLLFSLLCFLLFSPFESGNIYFSKHSISAAGGERDTNSEQNWFRILTKIHCNLFYVEFAVCQKKTCTEKIICLLQKVR